MKRNPHRAVLVFLLSFSLCSASLLSVPAAGCTRRRTVSVAKALDPVKSARANQTGAFLSDPGDKRPEAAGEPITLDTRSALSAAVFTAVGPGGPGFLSSFTTPTLLANNDGREDFTADRAQPV